MGFRVAFTSVAPIFFILCAAYLLGVAQRSQGMLVVQAFSGSEWVAREVGYRMLQVSDGCAADDFLPASPIGFVVAGWENTATITQHERVIDLLVELGCVINATGSRGLSALHSAVLFGNARAVSSMLQRGADSSRIVTLPAGHQNAQIDLDVVELAYFLDKGPDENRGAVIEILENHTH